MPDDDKTAVGEAPLLLGGEVLPALAVIAGVDVGRNFRLPEGETIIGRAESADFQIDDEGISRHHAKIERQGAVCRVVDLGSTNGTFVNDQRTKASPLVEGDRLQVGRNTILAFRLQHPLEEKYQQETFAQAARDPVTGLYRLSHLQERLQGEFSYAARHGGSLALILLEVRVVDADPDALARSCAEALRAAVRTEDVLARTGPSAFAVLSREGAPTAARQLAERLVQVLALGETKLPATRACAGVACLSSGSHRAPEELWRAAEFHLSSARDSGGSAIEGP